MFSPETKVLIVDDMLTMRKMISKACAKIGLENVTLAKDGNTAWEMLNATAFDLVISDWNMPNCTGIDLLHRIRSKNELSSLPFVMITAEREREQIQAANDTGVDVFIPKPFTQEDFEQKLKETYERRFGSKAS
jgi:two-component system chemotaxis response regulator CheY